MDCIVWPGPSPLPRPGSILAPSWQPAAPLPTAAICASRIRDGAFHGPTPPLRVPGNVFVIAAILLERNLQNVANYLIVSLAVADLMVACLVMPLGAVYEVSRTASTAKHPPSFDIMRHAHGKSHATTEIK